MIVIYCVQQQGCRWHLASRSQSAEHTHMIHTIGRLPHHLAVLSSLESAPPQLLRTEYNARVSKNLGVEQVKQFDAWILTG